MISILYHNAYTGVQLTSGGQLIVDCGLSLDRLVNISMGSFLAATMKIKIHNFNKIYIYTG